MTRSPAKLLYNVILINLYLTNEFSHHYQLDESTYIFRGVRSDFYFLSHFSMKFLCANRIAPDGTPRSARHIWDYAVCLCPTNRTPGLYELMTVGDMVTNDSDDSTGSGDLPPVIIFSLER